MKADACRSVSITQRMLRDRGAQFAQDPFQNCCSNPRSCRSRRCTPRVSTSTAIWSGSRSENLARPRPTSIPRNTTRCSPVRGGLHRREVRRRVVFVPMEKADVQHSHGVVAHMQKPEKAEILRRRYSPQQILDLVGRLDFAVGMRPFLDLRCTARNAVCGTVLCVEGDWPARGARDGDAPAREHRHRTAIGDDRPILGHARSDPGKDQSASPRAPREGAGNEPSPPRSRGEAHRCARCRPKRGTRNASLKRPSARAIASPPRRRGPGGTTVRP
jgi:hypothetical protein